MNQLHIRNFCIIAHIDHGKSTLADRLLELTETIDKRQMTEQILDSNPIERERGITIKLAPVRMIYKTQNLELRTQNTKNKNNPSSPPLNLRGGRVGLIHEFLLNLIDTPGHVDFSYEVSRSLAACEGAILLVDATVGVQAQTIANLTLARKQGLTIIPVINKIDLPNANIDNTIKQLIDLGFSQNEILKISAKTGENVLEVLAAIVSKFPPPSGFPESPLRSLVFSSQYDEYKGVVVFVRIVDGKIIKEDNQPILFMASNAQINPIEVGYFTPKMSPSEKLLTGEVGYIATGLKDIRLAKVGDTITLWESFKEEKLQRSKDSKLQRIQKYTGSEKFVTEDLSVTIQPLPGFAEPKSMVFLDLYPVGSDEYKNVRSAIEKLRLSDSAFSSQPVSSSALGHGFHCGFLGLLHAEVVQERLFREFDVSVLATTPSVEYRIKFKDHNSPHSPSYLKRGFTLKVHPEGPGGVTSNGSFITIQSPNQFPDPSLIEEAKEPIMQVTIFAPKKYVGTVMQFAQDRRGDLIDLSYQSDQAKLTYLLPLSEMIIDFFDQLKGKTEGFASLDYEFFDYQNVDLVKLDILLNQEKVEEFSQLVVREKSENYARNLVTKLKDIIPRHQFNIPIQAAIGGKIIARADVKPFRKDVTKKLYGGDRTRKDKLLEAQKKGKKRLKMFGKVEIPQEAFIKIFKMA